MWNKLLGDTSFKNTHIKDYQIMLLWGVSLNNHTEFLWTQEVGHHSINERRLSLYQLLPKVLPSMYCAFAGEAFIPYSALSAPC